MGISDEMSTSKMPTPLGRSAENRAAATSIGNKAYPVAATFKVAGGSALQLHATSSDKVYMACGIKPFCQLRCPPEIALMIKCVYLLPRVLRSCCRFCRWPLFQPGVRTKILADSRGVHCKFITAEHLLLPYGAAVVVGGMRPTGVT